MFRFIENLFIYFTITRVKKIVSYIKEFVTQRFVISRYNSALVNNNWTIQTFVSRCRQLNIIVQFIAFFNIFFVFSFSNKYLFFPFKSKYLSKKFSRDWSSIFAKGLKLLLLVIRFSCLYEFEFLNKVFFSYFLATGSDCQYQYDSQAFLFSLVNKPGWAPVKLPQTGQYNNHRYSILECSSHAYGPTFGAGHDIYIADYASSSSSSYTNLGHQYSAPSGYSYGSTFTHTFLAGTYQFTPDEVETFYKTT